MEVSLASKQWRLSQPKQAEIRGFEHRPLVGTSGSQRLTSLPTITMLVLMIFTVLIMRETRAYGSKALQ